MFAIFSKVTGCGTSDNHQKHMIVWNKLPSKAIVTAMEIDYTANNLMINLIWICM